MPIAIINRIINAELESVYQNKTKMQTKLLLVVVQIVSVILLVEKIESLMFHQMEYEVITEKVAISDVNDNVLFNTHIKSFRANRTFMAMNFTLGVKTNVNQVKIGVHTFKFMSNEYMHFPITLDIDLCKALEDNSFSFAYMLLDNGNFTKCPIRPGYYEIVNFGPLSESFPPKVPAGRYKLELDLKVDSIHGMNIQYFLTIKYF